MNTLCRWILLGVLVSTAGCISRESGGLRQQLEGRSYKLTMGSAPDGAEPVEAITIYQSGWYLLGFIPFMPLSLEHCIDELIAEVHRVGADGVSDLRVDVRPAATFRFYVFPIPDWGASISISGMAYRLPDGR